MKPTASGRILNYSSNHKVAQKLKVAMNLISRSIGLTDERYREEVDNKIDDILRINNPPYIIRRMRKRILTKHARETRADSETRYFKIARMNGLSEKDGKITRNRR